MSQGGNESLGSGKGNRKPRIGITIGDPAGIGPEIVAKAISDASVRSTTDLVLIGSSSVIRTACERFGEGIALVDSGSAEGNGNAIAVRDPGGLPASAVAGAESAETGRAAARSIETAVEMWKAG